MDYVCAPPDARSVGAMSNAEIHALAARYGTPMYVYDADIVTTRVTAVRKALEGQAQIYYAVKANPNLELMRAVREEVDGLDVSSGGEVEQALLAGYDSAVLSYAGPAKTTVELASAIDRSVGSISVESLRELEACATIAAGRNRCANVALRINPITSNRAFGLKMGGKPVQFGIDEEELGAAVDLLKRHSASLKFCGLHVYVGSQCFDADGLAASVANTLAIGSALESQLGARCRTINLGGGFGVSYGAHGPTLDLATAGAKVAGLLRDFRNASCQRSFVFELGRYLLSDAGLYVTRVINEKTSRGKSFFIVDGGLHHHLSAAGTFGASLRGNYVLENATRPSAERVLCTVTGSSCNPTDLLGIDVELPRPEVGDLVMVMKSGSYGLTASPLLFLGRDTPVELVRHRGEVVVGRRRHTMTEFN